MKFTLLFPIALAYAQLSAGTMVPDVFTQWGVLSILAWFLFYTIKFWIPAIENRKSEEDRRREAELIRQREDFLKTMTTMSEGFLATLKTIRMSNNRERKATRRILREVVDTEKSQMELILRISHVQDVIIRERDGFEQQLKEIEKKEQGQ